jgi:hypothetical protein
MPCGSRRPHLDTPMQSHGGVDPSWQYGRGSCWWVRTRLLQGTGRGRETPAWGADRAPASPADYSIRCWARPLPDASASSLGARRMPLPPSKGHSLLASGLTAHIAGRTVAKLWLRRRLHHDVAATPAPRGAVVDVLLAHSHSASPSLQGTGCAHLPMPCGVVCGRWIRGLPYCCLGVPSKVLPKRALPKGGQHVHGPRRVRSDGVSRDDVIPSHGSGFHHILSMINFFLGLCPCRRLHTPLGNVNQGPPALLSWPVTGAPPAVDLTDRHRAGRQPHGRPVLMSSDRKCLAVAHPLCRVEGPCATAVPAASQCPERLHEAPVRGDAAGRSTSTA